MIAIIFAAGIGSRLKPFTDFHPKALAPIGETTALGIVVEKLIRAGADGIVVNVHHFAEQIVEYLDHTSFMARITVSDETDLLLNTGGGLRKVLPLLGNEPVLIHNADIFTTFNIKELIYNQVRSGADATLLTQHRDSTRRLVFCDNDRMCGWTDLKSREVKHRDMRLTGSMKLESFDGIHIVNQSMYPALSEYKKAGEPFSIMDFYIDMSPRYDIRSMSLPEQYRWYDVGKPETLEQARHFFSNS